MFSIFTIKMLVNLGVLTWIERESCNRLWGGASEGSIKILSTISTKSLLFPNTLETLSMANFRALKAMISFHPFRVHNPRNPFSIRVLKD